MAVLRYYKDGEWKIVKQIQVNMENNISQSQISYIANGNGGSGGGGYVYKRQSSFSPTTYTPNYLPSPCLACHHFISRKDLINEEHICPYCGCYIPDYFFREEE